jgi:hypothetical protein
MEPQRPTHYEIVSMSDTTQNHLPGTNAYAGIRADKRIAQLDDTLKRTKKKRGEPSNLAALAKVLNGVIHEYDKSPEATLPIVEEAESLLGSIITRLNEIADESGK